MGCQESYSNRDLNPVADPGGGGVDWVASQGRQRIIIILKPNVQHSLLHSLHDGGRTLTATKAHGLTQSN